MRRFYLQYLRNLSGYQWYGRSWNVVTARGRGQAVEDVEKDYSSYKMKVGIYK